MRTPRTRYLRKRGFGRLRHGRRLIDFLADRVTALTGTGALTTFTAANATDQLTITTHGFFTGEGPFVVSNSGGALPAGLDAAISYWAIVVDANTIQLALTREQALAGNAVDFTDDGTGTQSIARAAEANEDIYDWMKYRDVKPVTLAAEADVDNL